MSHMDNFNNIKDINIPEDKNQNNNSKKSKLNIKKLLPFAIAIALIISILLTYQGFSYKNLLSNFKNKFDSAKYTEANNYILTKSNLNIFKTIFLKNDLGEYFEDKLSTIENNLVSNKITTNDANTVVKEIERYNILSSDKTQKVLSTTIDDNSQLSKGIKEYDKGNFENALNIFNSINENDSSYSIAKEYIEKCNTELKKNLLSQVEKYKEKEYFTAAINLIESKLEILKNDKELLEKVDELKTAKNQYLTNQKQSTAVSSSQIVNVINTSNINSLNIESLTDYLIYVDTNAQVTNVYKGNMNNWSLIKSMSCSTGKEGSETPTGVFDIRDKDEWFFSEQYQQGGKYWVQFQGDYLFHSIPYAKDKETILDTTLGKAASHGCIRLSLEDSKWLYETINAGTKVIIK